MLEGPTDHNVTPDAPKTESGPSFLLTLLLIMAGVLLVKAVMPPLVEEVYYSMERGRQRAQYDVSTERLENAPLSELSTASELVSRRIRPSVVHIDTRRGEGGYETDPRDVESAQVSHESRQIREQGSGIIMSEFGEIITNYHVIKNAERIIVTLSDNRIVEGEVIGIDRKADLALLKIDDIGGLIPAVLGDSDKLKEGALVWAAGSPFGLFRSITFGVLSSREREDGPYKNLLQSDVAVSPGNSGGPLVDATGSVIGINTAIVGKNFQGISLAIPSNRAVKIYEDILSKEPRIQHGWLGVRLAEIDDVTGAVVGGLIEEFSPAADAGVQPGDVVTGWNGEAIRSKEMFQGLIANAKINSAVELTLIRNGKEETLDVTVGVKPLQFH